VTRPVSLAEITDYLDGYLRIAEVPDEPNALNGLQSENRSGLVDRIVAAVDASLETIAGVAAGAGAPLLLVHHGLFWDGNRPLTERRYRRVRTLLEGDVALYSAHIPLDVHTDVGNNRVLARALGLTDLAPFDEYRGTPIGVRGSFVPALPRDALTDRVERVLGTSVKLIPGGPPVCHRLGIITGGQGAGSPRRTRRGSTHTSRVKAHTTPSSTRWSSA